MMIHRRDAIRVLSAAAFASGARAADWPLRFTSLDHVETSVPDSAKTAAFYARVFGGPGWKNNKTERRYVRLGPAYIAIEQGRQPFGVDHFSVGVADYQITDIHKFLQQQGIPYRDYPSGKDLNVTDPDGMHLQLSADNTWGPLSVNTASPEKGTFGGEPVFHPTGIDHILLNVSDVNKSLAFYEKILGPAEVSLDGPNWFRVGRSRIGLMKAPKPGVYRMGISAAAYNYAGVMITLTALRATTQRPEAGNTAEFLDPDGLRIQMVQ